MGSKNTPTWNSKQPFINGSFNWMIPNLYMENGCFTKHPFLKTGCLEFQEGIEGFFFFVLLPRGQRSKSESFLRNSLQKDLLGSNMSEDICLSEGWEQENSHQGHDFDDMKPTMKTQQKRPPTIFSTKHVSFYHRQETLLGHGSSVAVIGTTILR